MNGEENVVIGIDLGTYNSAAAILMGDKPIMLHSQEGPTDQGMSFPSFVEFDESGEYVRAGEMARRAMPLSPDRVVWGVKRIIGKSYKEAKKSRDIERFQYKIFEGRDGSCRIKVGRKEYSPTDISRYILEKIKRDAEAGFNPIGCSITEAVITVPAYFGPFQKAETEQAAKAAGFKKVHLIPEPTSAALAYKLRVERKNQYIGVIDLGAGTLDVTIALLYLDNNGLLQTEEKGHGGDTALGGLDMDDAILQYAINKYKLGYVMKNEHGKARLRTEIENAKIRLSRECETKVSFAFAKGDVNIVLTRQDVEAAVSSVVERCRGPIAIALREANLQPTDVSHVVLVGGPTMMQAVQTMIIEEFAENPTVVQELKSIGQEGFPVNPMEAVASGAVLGKFGGITPHTYGILVEGTYYEMIPRRQRYPCMSSASYGFPGSKRSFTLGLVQKALDPQTYQEIHLMLGIFQFDYRPEPGRTGVQIVAEYTENGVLNLRIEQPSAMVSLPLYNVSKLEGRRISKPPTPVPIRPPSPTPAGDPSGPIGQPPPEKVSQWSQNELDDAIRRANRVISVVQNRIDRAPSEDRRRIEDLVGDLKHWIGASWEDLNTRTPQIRNQVRALLNALVASGLMSREELVELQRGFN